MIKGQGAFFLWCVFVYAFVSPTTASQSEYIQKIFSTSQLLSFNAEKLLCLGGDDNGTHNMPDNQNNQEHMPAWLVRASLKNAPPLLRGIYAYLKSYTPCTIIPSFHRFILVGKPGTGKTTLAQAIASSLGYRVQYIAASSLLGHYRNETAQYIKKMFSNATSTSEKTLIIIDELHKLFENHANEHTDHSENAAAFWLALDQLEARHPHVVVIGTANNVTKLPPEIKSRFHGKIITIPLPSQRERLRALHNIIKHDRSLSLDPSISNAYLASLSKRVKEWSLRDVRLLFDTAKIVAYIGQCSNEHTIKLTRSHVEKAFKVLKKEEKELKEKLFDRMQPTLQKVHLTLGVIVYVGTLTQMGHALATWDLFKKINFLRNSKMDQRNQDTDTHKRKVENT